MAIAQTDPRRVGGTYRSAYWGHTYTVLAITEHADWRGLSITVRLADGTVREHGTAWDKRDLVISQPTDSK